MAEQNPLFDFSALLRGYFSAMAAVNGSSDYPAIQGVVKFYETDYGVLVCAEMEGLPSSTTECGSAVFGFHIHSGDSCTGNASDPFADAGTHFNPENQPHPCHAGDLPPLFGNRGIAFSAFLTNRFTVEEILNKTIILHDMPDDFTTQPSGNSGTKIACGVIRPVRRA